MYGKREGALDIRPEYAPDRYLVLGPPKAATESSKGAGRPWVVCEAFLFEARPPIDRLRRRGVKPGAATSVREEEWRAARIWPASPGSSLKLSMARKDGLRLFGP